MKLHFASLSRQSKPRRSRALISDVVVANCALRVVRCQIASARLSVVDSVALSCSEVVSNQVLIPYWYSTRGIGIDKG